MSLAGHSSPRHGVFEVSPNQEANGTLSLAGHDTRLYVWHDCPIEIEPGETISGTLDDLTKVSLIDCVVVERHDISRKEDKRFTRKVLPRFIVMGDRHFSREDRLVEEVFFSLRDSPLFNDRDAFSTSYFNDPDLIRRIVRSDGRDDSPEIGENNWITYYTGKVDIFSVDTSLGQISARHAPSLRVGLSVDQVPINRVLLGIKTDERVTIDEAMRRIDRILQFLDAIVGRSQSIDEVRVYVGDCPYERGADVYDATQPSYRLSHGAGEASPLDILIDPVREPQAFGDTLSSWLEKDTKWSAARYRLARAWSGSGYDYDRIVAAANVFDLLPREEYKDSVSVSPDLRNAADEARSLFKRLPASDERDRVLSFLGQVGEMNLKKKVRYRLKTLIDVITLPDIETVLDEAVNYRNYYVHGTPPRVASDQRSRFLKFFTDALEFCFLASDLVDAGWDLGRWCAQGRPRGHPFHDFLVDYSGNLDRLKKALSR